MTTLQDLIDKEFKGRAKKLDDIDLPKIGHQISVGEDHLRAFLEVESGGVGFDSKGRPKLLFEPHLFYKNLGAGSNRDLAVKQGLAYPKWGQKKYPRESYTNLFKACKINAEAAVKSASWGLTQILGSNFKIVKCKSLAEFVEKMMDDEENHVQMCVDFLVSTKAAKHLKNENWAGVARIYNGPGYAKNKYDIKMKKAFEKWKKIPDVPYDNFKDYLAETNKNNNPNTPIITKEIFEKVKTDSIVSVDMSAEKNTPITTVTFADGEVIQKTFEESDKEILKLAAPVIKKGKWAEENLTPEQIKYIQTRLRDLGYVMVGKIDGFWKQGGNVTAAICALQERAGITVDGHYGPQVREVLARNDDSNRYKVSEARANTTMDDLREQGSRTVKSTDNVKSTALVAGVSVGIPTVATVVEAGTNVAGYMPDAISYLTPVREFFADFPIWVWGLIIVVICIVLYYNANKAQKARLDDERTGKNVGLPNPANQEQVTVLSADDERIQPEANIPNFLLANKNSKEETAQVTR